MQKNIKHDYIALLCIVITAFILRVPFFTQSVIDWDESSFILAGQLVAEGNIPYVDFFDLKPPLAFLFYAFVDFIPKDISYVRFGACLCVIISATIIYFLSKLHWNQKLACFGSIASIYFISLSPSGQALMTELVVIVPLLTIIYFLQSNRLQSRIVFYIGLLASLAMLIRLNLIFCVLAFAVYIPLVNARSSMPYRQQCVTYCMYLLGVFVPVLIVGLFYYATGYIEKLILFLEVAWSYSQEQLAFQNVIQKIIFEDLRLYIFLWIGCFLTCKILVQDHNIFSKDQQRFLITTFIMIGAILFSMLLGGVYYGHYMIQLVPFAAMISIAGLSYYIPNNKYLFLVILVVFSFTFMPLLSVPSKESNRVDVAAEIATYLKEHTEGQSVYLMKWHIAYWLAGKQPIGDIIHPSNVTKSFITSNKKFAKDYQSLASVLDSRPDIIIKPEHVFYLDNVAGYDKALAYLLETEYQHVHTIGNANIYQLKAGAKS